MKFVQQKKLSLDQLDKTGRDYRKQKIMLIKRLSANETPFTDDIAKLFHQCLKGMSHCADEARI